MRNESTWVGRMAVSRAERRWSKEPKMETMLSVKDWLCCRDSLIIAALSLSTISATWTPIFLSLCLLCGVEWNLWKKWSWRGWIEDDGGYQYQYQWCFWQFSGNLVDRLWIYFYYYLILSWAEKRRKVQVKPFQKVSKIPLLFFYISFLFFFSQTHYFHFQMHYFMYVFV